MTLSNYNKCPIGGALTGERYRVIVSTDIGGTDPDSSNLADLNEKSGVITA